VPAGLTLRRAPNAPKGIRTPGVSTSFFVPDSLPYDRAALADATLTLSVALAASGEVGAVTVAAATFSDDPSGSPSWIQVHLQAHLAWPAAIAYRIVALVAPAAVR
jgi:hypothetical protein